jgi:hypothetical protein
MLQEMCSQLQPQPQRDGPSYPTRISAAAAPAGAAGNGVRGLAARLKVVPFPTGLTNAQNIS